VIASLAETPCRTVKSHEGKTVVKDAGGFAQSLRHKGREDSLKIGVVPPRKWMGEIEKGRKLYLRVQAKASRSISLGIDRPTLIRQRSEGGERANDGGVIEKRRSDKRTGARPGLKILLKGGTKKRNFPLFE